MKKFLLKSLKTVFLASLFGAVTVFAQFQGPSGTPSTMNAPAPLNTSSSPQSKQGKIGTIGLQTGGLYVGPTSIADTNTNFPLAGNAHIEGGVSIGNAVPIPPSGQLSIKKKLGVGNVVMTNMLDGSIGSSADIFAGRDIVSVVGNMISGAGAYLGNYLPAGTNGGVAAERFCLPNITTQGDNCISGTWQSGGSSLTLDTTPAGMTINNANKVTVHQNGIFDLIDNGGGHATLAAPIGVNWGDLLVWTKVGGPYRWVPTSTVTIKNGKVGMNNLNPNAQLDIVGNTNVNGNTNVVGNSTITGSLTLSALTGAANPVLCHDTTGKVVVCNPQPGTGGTTVDPGQLHHTLRWDGTKWADSGVLQNDNSHASTNAEFYVNLSGSNRDTLSLNAGPSETQRVAIGVNKDALQFWSIANGGHNADIWVRDVKADRDGYFGNLANAFTYVVCADSQGKLILCAGGPGNGSIDVKVNNLDAYTHDMGDVTNLASTGYAPSHTVTVSWTVSNLPGVTTCTASGAWSGSKNTSGGSETVTINQYGPRSFILNCSSPVANASDTATATLHAFISKFSGTVQTFTPSSHAAFANVNSITALAVGQGGSGGFFSNGQSAGQYCLPTSPVSGVGSGNSTVTYNGQTITANGGGPATAAGNSLNPGTPGNGSNANGAAVTPGNGVNPGIIMTVPQGYPYSVAGQGGVPARASGATGCYPFDPAPSQSLGGGAAIVTKTWNYTGGPITYVTNGTSASGTIGMVKISW